MTKGIALLVIFCVIGVFAPLDSTLKPQKAEALFPSFDPNSALSLVQETISATSLQSLELKEFTLDGIAYSLAKKALSQMTSNLVDWINSGFEGNPAFITDPAGFFRDIADQVAGDVLYELAGDLCSPFQLKVRVAINIAQQKNKESGAQCTFSGAIQNLANFAQGFSNWNDLFEITVRPENNIYGATYLASIEMDERIQRALGLQKEQLEWSGGFLSQKKCQSVPTSGGGTKEVCSIVTPGTTIAEALNKSLGAGQDALIEADEIDEIINALFAQLMEKAFTGVDGLLGLSQADADGGDTYLDGVSEGSGDDVGFNYGDNDPIQEALNNETKAANVFKEIISLVDTAEAKIGESCSVSVPNDLEDARDDAEAELASSGVILTTLTDMNTRYKATKDAEVKNDIYLDFLDLEAADYLYTSLELIGFDVTLENVKEEVKDLEDEIADTCE